MTFLYHDNLQSNIQLDIITSYTPREGIGVKSVQYIVPQNENCKQQYIKVGALDRKEYIYIIIFLKNGLKYLFI